MKKIILSLLLSSLFGLGYAQTNVSGGIFSNTTWTLTGSPYIVIDTTGNSYCNRYDYGFDHFYE